MTGGLCSFAALTAFLADVTVAPELMVLTHRGDFESPATSS
jgi:hypothetical protein